jgi:hypothetical protein
MALQISDRYSMKKLLSTANYRGRAKFLLAPSGLIVIRAANMKCAAVFTFVSLAFVSQTFAVVRPLFPVKPEPPLSGSAIVIGDDLIQNPSKNSPPAISR